MWYKTEISHIQSNISTVNVNKSMGNQMDGFNLTSILLSLRNVTVERYTFTHLGFTDGRTPMEEGRTVTGN